MPRLIHSRCRQLVHSLVLTSAFVSTLSAREKAPVVVEVTPPEIHLTGPRHSHRLLVTQKDIAAADVTGRATFKSLNPKVATVDSRGIVHPSGNGSTEIAVHYLGQEKRAIVRVERFEQEAPVDFYREVVAALSRGGCNQGACHGSPKGKGGFRLSLRGFEPGTDLLYLTRESNRRRLNPFDATGSLILQKATAKLPHHGGRRFRHHDPAYQVLKNWIAAGHPVTDKPATMKQLEVLPKQRLLDVTSPKQQIVVRAHFADGAVRDVTDLAVFSTIESESVSVTTGGVVEFHHTAEAAILVRYLDRIETSRLTFIRQDPKFRFVAPRAVNKIDQLIFAKQKQLQLRPSAVANDGIFLRRVYTDLIGGLPTPEEALAFLDSKAPDKRAHLIDRLLRRKEYAQFWALKWADVMRGNRETITERGVHVLHRYLVRNFASDRPFDQVAREIVTSMGNTIHEPAASFYRVARTPTDAAESLSQLFLGVRIGCAKCHNHPYESITQRDYYSLAASFARVKLKGQRFGLDDEVVYLSRDGEVTMPTDGKAVAPAAFGTPLKVDDNKPAEYQDRRQALADWLTSKDNRYFAHSTVNRIWFHLMGQGLVDPIDDFRDSNPASNPQLLDALAKTFVDSGYRFKPVIRLILNSHTYQLSPRSEGKQSEYAADPARYFTKPIVGMLSAEQLIDAISMATGIDEQFPGYPAGTKAIALAEGAVEHKFLKAFTKPVRDVACDCARETEPTMNQILHLINNPELLAKIDSPKSRLAKLLKANKPAREIIKLIYLATLSRRPTTRELQIAKAHLKKAKQPQEAYRDLQHALLNSNEFLLRH